MLPSPQTRSTLPPLDATPWPSEPLAQDYGIIGQSPALLRAVEYARQAARSGADVLIESESGTGKELLARLIHGESARAERPLIPVNCAAIPDTLLESELFGHVRGAFTGAHTQQTGKFELAHQGTLLLDEVGELPLSLQPKLLRVLQEREFYRLGDVRPQVIDVRLIATTNRSLREMILQRRFREDLYYRLAVITLSLPPLRERGDDLVLLAKHFAAKFSGPNPPPQMDEEFLECLRRHPWPGNIRELANVMRRASAFSESGRLNTGFLQLGCSDFTAEALPVVKPGLSMRELEKCLLEITLDATAGNRTRAAELLGISLRTVRNKIREYGLPPRRWA